MGVFFLVTHKEVKYAAFWDIDLKQVSDHSHSELNIPKENEGEYLKEKKEKKGCVVSPKCAGKVILLYPSTMLVLATSQICITHLANQLSNKTSYLCFMNTNGEEAVTVMSGNTRGTYCMINCVYHVSLPYKPELAKFKTKELPPFFIMVSV